MSELIRVEKVFKQYKNKMALKNINFNVKQGQVLGLIGSNGAGKSTLLQALTGMHNFSGNINVFGMEPWKSRVEMLKNVSFIPDVNTLPEWMTPEKLFSVLSMYYPKFEKDKSEKYLSSLKLSKKQKVKTLSKGMKAQLHLALMVSIDSELLILDEPTLGLDPIAREKFYKILMEDFYNETKTIIISSHQVEEIEPLLTHVMIIDDGEIILYESVAELQNNYRLVQVPSKVELLEQARSIKPIYEFKGVDSCRFVYNNNNNLELLNTIGKVSFPNLSDLFKALHLGRA